MNEIIEKAKNFGKEHKKALTIIGVGTGLIIAFIAGEKYDNYCVADGLNKVDKAGLIDWKVPDGDDFKVVSVKEFDNYIQEHADELRKIK